MAAERTRFTTDQVVSFFFADESSSEDGENVEETFTEHVGIALSDSEEERADTDLLSRKNVSAGEDSVFNTDATSQVLYIHCLVLTTITNCLPYNHETIVTRE